MNKKSHALWVFPESGDAMVCTTGKDGGEVVPLDLVAGFDLETDAGYIAWCVSQRLENGGEEPVAEIFNSTGMTALKGLLVDGHQLTDAEADCMQHEMCQYLARLFALSPKMREFIRHLAVESIDSWSLHDLQAEAQKLMGKLSEDE